MKTESNCANSVYRTKFAGLARSVVPIMRHLADKLAAMFPVYGAIAWCMFAVGVSIVSVIGHMQIGLNHDNNALLNHARRLLAGYMPYQIDPNPPLIDVINTIPVLIAHIARVPYSIGLHSFTLVLTVLALIASAAILRTSGVRAGIRWQVISVLALGLLAASFVNQVFSDREHLMMVLAAPWFILYSPLSKRDRIPSSWRITVAAMAAVGFAIKPYFYVFYLATFCYEIYLTRSLRMVLSEIEHHIVWAFACLYLILLFLLFPEYPLQIFPLALATYPALSGGAVEKINVLKSDLLKSYEFLLMIGVFVVWLGNLFDRTIAYLLLLVIASGASFVLNGGWPYTQYPLYAFCLALSYAITCKLIAFHSRLRHLLCLCVVSALFTGWLSDSYYDVIKGWAKASIDGRARLPRFFEDALGKAAPPMAVHLQTHPKFVLLSTNLWDVILQKEGMPMESVGRYGYLWPMTGILRLKAQPEKKQTFETLRSYIAGGIADDIMHNKPDMIIHDISPLQRGLPLSYNLINFFKSVQVFEYALNDYLIVDTIQTCTSARTHDCAYEIYYRK